MSASISIIMTLLLIIFIVYTLCFFFEYKNRLNDPVTKQRFGSLYLNINPDIKYAIMSAPLFMIRRMIFCANIIFTPNNTLLQLLLQTICSLFLITFFVRLRPMETTFLNCMEIVNESSFLICCYLMFLFT